MRYKFSLMFWFGFLIVMGLAMVSAKFGFNNPNLPQMIKPTVTSTPTQSTINDVGFEINKEYVLFEPFNPTLAIETGEVGTLGWGYAGTVTLSGTYRGNHPGTAKVSTGTTSNTNSSINLGGGADWIIDSTSGNISYTWLVNISHPPAMTNNYTIYIGLHDAVAATVIPTDGIFFMLNTTLGNGNITCVSSNNNARTYNITKVQVNGAWIKLRVDIQNISGAYQQKFYIDDSLVCHHGAVNLPMGTARAFGNGAMIKKYGGTTARTIDLDYWYYKQTFAIPR
jgi:hypothetical protein